MKWVIVPFNICYSYVVFFMELTHPPCCCADKATQKKLATDPMYKLEHGSDDQQRGKVTNLSVAQIEDIRGAWNDDYILNKMARNKFRVRISCGSPCP